MPSILSMASAGTTSLNSRVSIAESFVSPKKLLRENDCLGRYNSNYKLRAKVMRQERELRQQGDTTEVARRDRGQR